MGSNHAHRGRDGELADSKNSRVWLVDYSVARRRAIEWLGDRYLLAKPINGRGVMGSMKVKPGLGE
jgi:hypothetical protein